MSDEKRGETFVMRGEPKPGAPEAPITFSTFLIGLASSALIHLGEAPNPETGKAERDLVLARQSLDLLGMLQEKTRGNLTGEEKQLFDNLLADLRLRFVEANKR
ncbi:DUF1844 domain-containing protein [Cystobacter fuscus]|jgi:hypothetical protein|uniref:DUF1844 domain-containing protein n=1 Tax=Cystobacter fuscus TaxID=43 RepID=A0A250JD43_9BACT|nr:DUF1844 domain-containing protein [Cystobacter fuscus]ATB41437.1 hypothetical protein CYFUS_006903 [Cystobacter fuscus]WNG19159.1 DUF1844 domain-containing protein [Cystobacter fuscus]WNG28698.1 DUF1844 domain-containing protein [Cystobacter fuscus]